MTLPSEGINPWRATGLPNGTPPAPKPQYANLPDAAKITPNDAPDGDSAKALAADGGGSGADQINGAHALDQILGHADHGDSPCPMVRDLLAARLPDIHARIRELQALATRMERALETWRDMPDGTPDGHSLCRLIESLPMEDDGTPAHTP